MAKHAIAAPPAPSSADNARSPVRLVLRVALPILLVIAGLAVMLYPVVATQVNNMRQNGVVNDYLTELENRDPVENLRAVADARHYNDTRTQAPILDPWLARVSGDNHDYQEYLTHLADGPAMAHLKVPSIGVSIPVYHGTTEEVLQKGVGHLYGSSLPVGGDGTHAVLTGHTGLSTATLFDNLTDVREGDEIFVNTYGEKLKYVVHDITVVEPTEVDTLAEVPGEDLLTLVTCTPYGINTHRLLVTGHRVPLDEDERSFDRDGLHWQWWMILAIALAVAVLAALIWWLRKIVKNNKENR